MERDWLEARLAEGRSIESIAKEVGKHPSTVGYWVKKHGLLSAHAASHAARGGVERETLSELVERGLSVRADRCERSGWASRAFSHWLSKYELRTDPLHYSRRDGRKPPDLPRECPRHGWTDYVRIGARRVLSLSRGARSERVAARRRRIKEILVAEAGGRCVLCGYDAYTGALQFHHRDPSKSASDWPRRHHEIARGSPPGGSEVRATVRKLPRGGGSRAGAAGRSSSR